MAAIYRGRANCFTAAFAKGKTKKKPTFLFLRAERVLSGHSRGCVIFPQNRATYKQRFSSIVDELLGIFEWKCGGGLADGGNRLHSCAASGRAGHTAYIHTQSFTTHSDVLWGTPKSSIKQLTFYAPVLNELTRQKV